MEWNDETLTRLSEIFGDKSREIRNDLIASGGFPDIDSEFGAYDITWNKYVSSLGLTMGFLKGSSFALDPPSKNYLSDDGTRMVRIVNAWEEKYIDMTEDFAIKILTLGFLP